MSSTLQAFRGLPGDNPPLPRYIAGYAPLELPVVTIQAN